MLRIVMSALRTGVVTTRYPEKKVPPPDRFRGAPELRPGSRLPPPEVCPSGALSERFDGGERHVGLDLARCVFCGRCGEVPWDGAVTIGRDFELAARSRDDLQIEVVADDLGPGAASAFAAPLLRRDSPGLPALAPLQAAPGAVASPQAAPGAVASSQAAPGAAALAKAARDTGAARASSEIRRVLGRSLHLRHLDAGSCNACDWELTALLNPVYDVRRLGIDFVASPRHADGVIVTGSVTRNLETAVRRTIEAIPDPRIVIAVGACAASGGIVGTGTRAPAVSTRCCPSMSTFPAVPHDRRPSSSASWSRSAAWRRVARRVRRDAQI